MNPATRTFAIVLALELVACGEGTPTVQQRGFPDQPPIENKASGTSAGGGGGASPVVDAGGGGPGPEAAPPRPDRPRIVISRDDFGPLSRDPFQTPFAARDEETVTLDAPRTKQREVRMADYNFEDLKLIGVVLSSRNIRPRALFVASDGKSKTVRQGEFFSRAEVMLASVNRDYVEIEVVDEELAKGLNMTRGERRAIYLKTD